MRERLQQMKAEGFNRPRSAAWSTIIMHSRVPAERAWHILNEVYNDSTPTPPLREETT